MARIAGVDIPRDKRVVVSLTYVYGIGLSTAKQILKDANVSEETRVKALTEDEMNRIRTEILKYTTEGDLRRCAGRPHDAQSGPGDRQPAQPRCDSNRGF